MTRAFLITTFAAAAILVSTPARAQTVSVGPYYATPSWDQKLQCDTQTTCPRFVVLSNLRSEAVLDRETGLVWERTPDTLGGLDWFSARFACANRSIGGVRGYRLPSVHEAASLLTEAGGLPAGHPFNVDFGDPNLFSSFWTATVASVPPTLTPVDGITGVWIFDGINVGVLQDPATGLKLRTWCVRGGGPLSAY